MDGLTPDDVAQRLESLWQGVVQPPQFREESRDHTLVYGYVCATGRRLSYVRACRRVLERFCQRERLRLSGLFIDRDAAPDQIQRPGFSGLCDVLRLPDSFAAVAVDTNHRSPDSDTATALVGQLRSPGARLLVVRRPPLTTNLQPPTFSDSAVPEWWQ